MLSCAASCLLGAQALAPPAEPARATRPPGLTTIPMSCLALVSTVLSSTRFMNWSKPRRVPVTCRLALRATGWGGGVVRRGGEAGQQRSGSYLQPPAATYQRGERKAQRLNARRGRRFWCSAAAALLLLLQLTAELLVHEFPQLWGLHFGHGCCCLCSCGVLLLLKGEGGPRARRAASDLPVCCCCERSWLLLRTECDLLVILLKLARQGVWARTLAVEDGAADQTEALVKGLRVCSFMKERGCDLPYGSGWMDEG